MAKNIQAINAMANVYRDNVADFCLGTGMSDSARQARFSTVVDSGTPITGINFLGGTTARSYRIDVPNNSNTYIGRIRCTGYATWSSRRWKENIKAIDNGLSIVQQLRPCEFDWKKENGGAHDTSFIAEELYEAIPHAVDIDEEGNCNSIESTRIIPYLTAAIQEQQALIEELRSRVLALENHG